MLNGLKHQTNTLIIGATSNADLSALFMANVFGRTSAKITTRIVIAIIA